MIPTKETIKAERELLGLTQTQAAAIVYSTVRTWQKWEAGAPVHPAIWECFLYKTRSRRARRQTAKSITEGEK